jgi:hypothetical protein
VIYFSALGCGFLFLEMAFIQKLILFLGHPLYAASVVIASFLVFAGLGSRFSSTLRRTVSRRFPGRSGTATLVAVAAVALLSFMDACLVDLLSARLSTLQDGARIGIAIAALAPLAFWMGMPFPLGLSMVAESRPAWVPWAWGVNGCASVLATVLATLLAIHFGFTTVVALAVALYGLAALAFWKPFSPCR